MGKTISRTFIISNVVVKNAENGKLIKEVTMSGKTTKKAIMKEYLKNTEDKDIVSVLVTIDEKEERREMGLETFLKYSSLMEKSVLPNEKEE